MAYATPPDFTPFDILTAAQLDILSNNDISFNNGTGIFGLYKNLLATDSNPYKFSAYRTAAHNSANAPTIVPLNLELYDTNSNYSTSTYLYTAPVAGFYWFAGATGNTLALGDMIIFLYKNGSEILRGNQHNPAAAGNMFTVSGLLQLAANDTVGLYFAGGNGSVMYATQSTCYMQGFLVSRT